MVGENKRKLSLMEETVNRAKKKKINGGLVLNPYTSWPYSAKYFEILEKRRALPVWQQKIEFLNILAQNQTMVLIDEIGMGKTTQIPQFVVKAGYASNRKQVTCMQPKKVVAMLVSQCVVDKMEVTIGDEVGYSIRFKDCNSSKTILKYLIDGMLLQKAMTNPLLERYRVIIHDEVHERTLANDVLFSLLKKVLKNRLNLKLIVMNATLKAEKFQAYFNGASLIKVPGSLQPVNVIYSQEPKRDYLQAAIRTVVQIHVCEPPRNILVFLTGEEEIEDACKKISREVQNLGDHVGPVKAIPFVFCSTPSYATKGF